jgi:Flp pilus assembly protein TadD
MVHAAQAAPPQARRLWIDRPWVDLLIGCGGWSAPLLIVSYLLLDKDAQRWASVFYGLALVCNYPHYMATVHRAYARGEDRAQYRLFTFYLTGLLLIVAAAAHVRPVLLPWLFTIYVMWSPWHYTGQNFGLTMMFLRRAGANVTPLERRWLRISFVASYVMLLAAFNSGDSLDPLVLSLGVPRTIALAIEIAAGVLFLGAGALALVPIARRIDVAAMLPAATLCVTQACWFVIPIAMTWASAVPAPQTRYSSGILAVMHSAQYLWITRHYAQRDHARRSATHWSNLSYWGTLVIGGVALFLPGPWLASYVGHFDFTSSMLIVTAIVNIHHFMLDGVVWKLRDPRVSQALVDGAAPAEATLSKAGRAGKTVAIWITRPVVVAVLITLAALDQWRYTLAQRDTDPNALETASELNPYDGSVHLKLARFLIESGRYEDAYARCQLILAQRPNDVDTLVNAGVLAYRLNDPKAAETWWTRAVTQDATLREVHLYLAELIDAAGRTRDALPHYERYLELLTQQSSPTSPPDARKTALVLVKFADALSTTGKTQAAASQYDLAIRIAQQSGQSDVETLARQHKQP